MELKTYRTKVSWLQGNITSTGGEKSNTMGGYKVNINVIKMIKCLNITHFMLFWTAHAVEWMA